jgi:hypothetical protein
VKLAGVGHAAEDRIDRMKFKGQSSKCKPQSTGEVIRGAKISQGSLRSRN